MLFKQTFSNEAIIYCAKPNFVTKRLDVKECTWKRYKKLLTLFLTIKHRMTEVGNLTTSVNCGHMHIRFFFLLNLISDHKKLHSQNVKNISCLTVNMPVTQFENWPFFRGFKFKDITENYSEVKTSNMSRGIWAVLFRS